MKLILLIFAIFTVISVNAQYTLTDDNGNPISNGETVTTTYELTSDLPLGPEGEFDCHVHSTNMNNFLFEIVSTDQCSDAENWFCTNLGLCYTPETTELEVELFSDSTREMQLHYRPNGCTDEVTINYRITEIGNSNNTISFSVKYVIVTGINNEIIDDSKIIAFPNPANQFTQIKYDVNVKANVYLYNNIGKIVKVYPIDNSNETININTSELKAGIYFYQVVTDSKLVSTSKKLIVIH